MLILFATDLHGATQLYDQILELARSTQPRVVVLGGDLYRNGKPWAEDARRQRLYVETRLAEWTAALAERCPGVEVLVIPGNHCWRHACDAYDLLAARGLPLRDLHLRAHQIDDVWFSGYGCTPPSVFPTKDYERWDDEPGVTRTGCGETGLVTGSPGGDLRKVDFRVELDACATMAVDLATLPSPPAGVTSVLVTHSPPWDSGLDHMWHHRPIGSTAVRDHILRHRPTVSLHGHVHEAPEVSGRWYTTVGSTLAINPGRTSGTLAAALFDTNDPAGTLRHTLLPR